MSPLRVTSIGAQVLFIGVLLAVALAPFLAPGASAVDNRLPEAAVDECAPTTGSESAENATIVAVVEKVSNRTVRVDYRTVGELRDPSLEVSLSDHATPVNTTGFRATGFARTAFRWVNGSEHSIEYRMSPDDSYPAGEDWLIATKPDHERESVAFRFRPNGTVGPELLYVGNHTTESVTVGCQEITAVIPNATTAEQRRQIRRGLDTLTAAARSLPVGEWDEQVIVYASPSPLPGEYRGFALIPGNEIVIQSSASRTDWIHEYIHIRQSEAWEGASSLSWTKEAMPSYLSHRIAVEHGMITPREYDRWLLLSRHGNWSEPLASAEAGSWIEYSRGAVILARVDASLDRAGNGSVVEMFRRFNQQRGGSTAALLRYLDSRGVGDDGLAFVRRATRSNSAFSVPTVLGPDWIPEPAQALIPAFDTPWFRVLTFAASILAIDGLRKDLR